MSVTAFGRTEALPPRHTAAPRNAPARSERDETGLVSVTIRELMSTEERLAHQSHLGDLHPAHARRLAAVTAELDRRWSEYA